MPENTAQINSTCEHAVIILWFFSSVGSGTPGKYSYAIVLGYLSLRVNFSGKIISIKHNQPIVYFDNFFSNGDFHCVFIRMVLFLEKLILHQFSRVTILWHSSYFFGAAISSEQLPFLRSSFFRTVTFLQQLFFQSSYFFRAKLLSSSHL